MTKYHAVMLGETREEFGVTFEAESRDAAYDYLAENYPESSCVQLEDPDQTAAREAATYRSIQRELDGDDEDYDDDEGDYNYDAQARYNAEWGVDY